MLVSISEGFWREGELGAILLRCDMLAVVESEGRPVCEIVWRRETNS